MRKLLLKLLAFAAALAGFYLARLAVAEARHFPRSQGESSSVLAFIGRGRSYDAVILGNSHARALSEHGNHARMEAITGARILNLAKPGAGVLPQRQLLEYFLRRRNGARTALIFLDHFMFLNRDWNENLRFLDDEPVRPDFIAFILSEGMGAGALHDYLNSKLNWAYFMREKAYLGRNDRRLNEFTMRAAVERAKGLYRINISPEQQQRYLAELDVIVALCRTHGVEPLILLTPATFNVAFTDDKGRDIWLTFLDNFKARTGVPYHDLRKSIPGLRYYADTDHLNTEGVKYFSGTQLRRFIHRGAAR